MRWLSYFILAYISLGLQTGLAGFDTYRGAWPNFVLLAVVFIAVNAPREPALIGSLILGLLQDMATQQPLGLYAFSYGLVAMFIVSTQQTLYREHALTYFTMTLFGGFITGAVVLVHGWIHPPKAGITGPLNLLASTIYTAVLAPFVFGVLRKFKKLFDFQPRRRVY